MANATTLQTGSMNDREATGSQFASADELHTLSKGIVSRDQQLQEFFDFHNPPETSPVQAGPIVAEEAQVQERTNTYELNERVTREKILKDTYHISTGKRASFSGNIRKSCKGLTLRPRIYSHVKIHDVLAIPTQMQPNISSTPLVDEVDVWWRTTEVSMGDGRNLKRIEFQTIRQRIGKSVAVHGSVYTRDEVCWGYG
ncbi:hypothetical protein Syun_000865 [Stephania yunnanensis]|uniref:Uncharacterized protein n=1 Tax=Stephania yunnanensis TaxID=152371 RepID=A0AAP0LDS0_9MAGN